MLDLARVVAAHPQSNAVDLEFLADSRRVAGVSVMTGLAGTDFGCSGVVGPEVEGYGEENNRVRDVYAVVGKINDHPLVLGFLFPQVSQLLFGDERRMIYRHPSDLYMTIDGSGNAEIAHPSGAFIRFGTSPAHEDLTGRDFDGVWKIARNTDQAVHIHVEQAGGVGSVDIDPVGAIVARSDLSITLEAPMLYLRGEVVQHGGAVSIEGDTSMAGTLNVAGDAVAAGISVSTHDHVKGPGAPV